MIETKKTPWGAASRVRIDGESVYFESFNRRDAEMRALVFEALREQVDCDRTRRGTVPTSVACSGKPIIAAYLYSIHGLGVDDIAERVDVSPTTVRQYMSDVRRGRR